MKRLLMTSLLGLVLLGSSGSSFATAAAVGNKSLTDINWGERIKEMEEMVHELQKIKGLESAVSELRDQVKAQNAIIEKNLVRVEELEKQLSPLVAVSKSKTIRIEGDGNLYYPVWFPENMQCWSEGETRLQIAKASVHADGDWSGSTVARFSYHSSWWGNGSGYLEAAFESAIRTKAPYLADFELPLYPAGLVVWLKGGGETYTYKSNCTVNAVVDLEKPLVLYNDPAHPEYTIVKDRIGQVSAKVGTNWGKGWSRYGHGGAL
ncbi:MAG: hypothetical protein HQK50_01055 [Oligoflexia bacterium]|nr:hypothetical protein [Oligoflexia bacterium]